MNCNSRHVTTYINVFEIMTGATCRAQDTYNAGLPDFNSVFLYITTCRYKIWNLH